MTTRKRLACRLPAVVILLGTGLLGSCGGSPQRSAAGSEARSGGAGADAAKPHGASYMPLEQGHRLEYRLTNSDGTKVGVTQVVDGDLEVNGLHYAIVLTTFSDGLIVDDPMYYREGASGTYTYDPGTSREILILPSPVRPDTEWTERSERWVTRHRTTAGADVEAEGCTYHDCLEVETESRGPRGKQSNSTCWYAPGIGMVKFVGRGDNRFVQTLVRHSDSP
jgi:hypothetical protein